MGKLLRVLDAEEHMARLKAEAEAEDKAARLQVAQEQLAEYALDKLTSATDVLGQAQLLEHNLESLLQASGPRAEVTSIIDGFHQLKEKLRQAATEAQAFAEQQRADVERYKRSSQQVGPLPTVSILHR